jgi:hypothetical protein
MGLLLKAMSLEILLILRIIERSFRKNTSHKSGELSRKGLRELLVVNLWFLLAISALYVSVMFFAYLVPEAGWTEILSQLQWLAAR